VFSAGTSFEALSSKALRLTGEMGHSPVDLTVTNMELGEFFHFVFLFVK